MVYDDKYSMFEKAWKLAVEAQHYQWALAGAPVETSPACWLPSSPSSIINPHTPNAVSFQFCLLLIYQIYNIDYAPQYTLLKLQMSSIEEWVAKGVRPAVIRS